MTPRDYFSEEPFGCKCGCGLRAFDPEMRRILNEVRTELGIPLIINSGCRCRAYNASLPNSAPNSAHLPGPDGLCHAADIKALNAVTRGRLLEALQRRGIRRFEASNRHLHADNAQHLPAPVLEAIYFQRE